MPVTLDSTLIERPTSFANLPATNPVTGQQTYRGCVAIIPNVANLAGSGAGATVTTAVTFGAPPNGPGPGLPPSGNYTIEIAPNQACAASWSSKTTTGFNVVLTPLTSGATIAAGFFDVVVRWSV